MKAIQEVSFGFSFDENEGECVTRTLVSIAFCGIRKSIKSASHGPHPALCRGASQNVLAPVD